MPVVDFSLTDQIALVTGASRGIGEAIARGFAEQGATVVLASRKQEGLDRVAESIRADGGKAVPIAVTPATWSRSRPCSTAFESEFGRPPRAAQRDRRRGGVPGLEGRELHDRCDDRDGRGFVGVAAEPDRMPARAPAHPVSEFGAALGVQAAKCSKQEAQQVAFDVVVVDHVDQEVGVVDALEQAA